MNARTMTYERGGNSVGQGRLTHDDAKQTGGWGGFALDGVGMNLPELQQNDEDPADAADARRMPQERMGDKKNAA